MNEQDLNIISELYWHLTGGVKTGEADIRRFGKKKSHTTRMYVILSLRFYLFSEGVLKEVIDNIKAGVN